MPSHDLTLASGAPTVADPTAPTMASDNAEKRPALTKTSHDMFTLLSGEAEAAVVDVGIADLAAIGRLDRYDAGPLLGAGGMGEVRLSADRRVGRRVARKTLLAGTDSPKARARFLREARVQGQLEHPSIVPVYEIDVDAEGRPFFTMKRVRGDTLERVIDHLRRGDAAYIERYSERRLLAAFAQACLAVDYAHARGVLHRDLKPGNVMLGDFGEVYVLDWGLAKLVGEAPSAVNSEGDDSGLKDALTGHGALTGEGAVLGTPAYMAPEQIVSGDAVDARADVYALGAILFEILTLTSMRPAARLDETLKAALSGASAAPSERRPDVAPELDALCARALKPDPTERLASARELAVGVERYLDGDRDLSLRRALAQAHVARARALQTGGPSEAGGADESPRVLALREAIRALALDADDRDAQRLFVGLIVDTESAPREALPEIEAAADRSRAEAARSATHGLLAWLAVLPMVIVIGVRSHLAVGLTAATAALAAAFAFFVSRRPSYGARAAFGMAALVGAVVALSSCYLGPFALVPTAAVSTMMIFAMHATPRERRMGTAVVTVFASLPYVAELTGVLGRSYVFESDRMIVLARAIALPGLPTLLAMLYSTLSFVVLASWLVGRMRDALARSQEQKIVQAWLLRRLFPDVIAE